MGVRVIYVVGTPSGGTSATAGALTLNGAYNNSQGVGNWESPEAYKVVDPFFVGGEAFPPRNRGAPPGYKHMVRRTVARYQERAEREGKELAVMKAPWHPIWCPELFDDTGLEPLLVYRREQETEISFNRRFPNLKPKGTMAYAQREIRRLHNYFGWKMFRFEKNATSQDRLAELLGINLPVQYFTEEGQE